MLATTRQAADYPVGLELGLTGSAAINADMLLAAEKSIHTTEATTIALVVLILLAVYRAPGLVLVPLLVILATWVLSIDLLALLAALSRRVTCHSRPPRHALVRDQGGKVADLAAYRGTL
jgi:uncharacterized membrane protein YdfJ with MMPL/SSD domain